MKLLLTGATGFVGRNLLLRALAENRYDEIYVVVRSLEKLNAQFVGDGFEAIPSKIKPVVTSAPDWQLQEVPSVDHVIHTAGVISAQKREDYFRANVEGTVEFFKRLPHSPKKTVILSSQAAAGPCKNGEVKKEEDLSEPVTWYGESKLEMEKRMAAEFPRLPYICLRPPMVFGPRDQATLPLFKMARKLLFFKAGFKSKFYSYISVFDLVSAVFMSLEDTRDWSEFKQRCFFVASSNPVSDRELIFSVASTCNRKGMLVRVPQPVLWGISRIVNLIPAWRTHIPNLTVDRAKEIWPDRWVVSSEAFEKKFQWKPFEKLSHTLRQTRDWYVKTGQLRA